MNDYAAKSFLPRAPISIENASVERLQLLQQVQGDRDWLLTIYANEQQQALQLQELQDKLDKSKFHSFIEKDAGGRDVLRLHYVARETNIADGFEKLGLIGGMRHAAEYVFAPLKDAFGVVADFAHDTATEPARLLSALYFLGDCFYANAGSNNKEDGKITLEGRLMNLSGKMAIAQSLIYTAFARDGSEHEIEQIRKRMQSAISEGKQPFDVEVWSKPIEKGENNLFDNMIGFVRKHPIEIGAYVQMAGQVAMIASGALTVKKGDNNGYYDIGRAATSITAWGMLQMNEEHVEQKTDWHKNPFARGLEEIKSSPHRFASTVNTAASLIGIQSSLSKMNKIDVQLAAKDKEIEQQNGFAMKSDSSVQYNKLEKMRAERKELFDKRPNNSQIQAELTYLAGDMTMFFARKSDYGGQSATDTKQAAKAAACLIETSQILMTPVTRNEFVDNLSNYLAGRIVNEEIEDGKMQEAVRQLQVQEIASLLHNDIMAEISARPQNDIKAANIIARLAMEIEPTAQDRSIEKIITRLADFNGVNIDVAEMHALVDDQLKILQTSRLKQNQANNTNDLIAELTLMLPSVNAAYNANELFETINPLTGMSNGYNQLLDSMYEKAKSDLEMVYKSPSAVRNEAELEIEPALKIKFWEQPDKLPQLSTSLMR
jgi:hypothetical protein